MRNYLISITMITVFLVIIGVKACKCLDSYVQAENQRQAQLWDQINGK